jgi:SP family myo-inositol transporter-like MFS transporter 13
MEGGAHEFDGSTFKECFSLSWRNPYVLRLAFSAGIGGLLFGYDTGACVRPSFFLPACLRHCTFISSPAKFSRKKDDSFCSLICKIHFEIF